MKVVEWKSTDGRKHRSILRDSDPDTIAPSGLPDDPPSIDELDWEQIKTDLHNELISRGIITWKDLVSAQNSIAKISQSLLRKRIVELYKRRR